MAAPSITTQDLDLRAPSDTAAGVELPTSEASLLARPGSLGHLSCGGDLTVGLHQIDDVLVVVPCGAVGAASRAGLYAAMNTAFATRPARIVVNGALLTDCSIRGLATFIDAAQRARGQELLGDLHHLQQALNDGQTIEQAKGILMAMYGLDADAALEALRWHCRALDIRLRVLASALIAVVRQSPVGTAPSVRIDVFLAELAPVRDRLG